MKLSLRKIVILSTIFVSIVTFFALSYASNDDKKEKVLLAAITEILKSGHFSPQELTDTFSVKVYNLYLNSIDFNKLYLTKEDITVLESYKTKIDDEIKNSSLDFFNLSYEIITKKLNLVQTYYTKILGSPLNLNQAETFETDEKKRDYAANDTELEKLWYRFLKVQVLDEMIIIENENKKAHAKSDSIVIKTYTEIEKEAREKVLKRYSTRFKRIDQLTRDDRFSSYLNAITMAFDPHTNYFPPKQKKDFDISMSGKLEGIGATLSEKDGYIKIVEIVPGSPSWKQGELKAEDIILKVAQGDNEPVDIVDMRLDDAVQLIRGPKGTKVVLTVKKIDGKIVQIPIIRDVIMLEEKYAKSAILQSNTTDAAKIGYIYLPQFYTDMNDRNGRSCSDDIKKEILALQKENVEGIILDLRDNGGGSLQDVVEIGGFFIDKGPIVQVVTSGKQRRVLNDYDPQIVYTGPLVILVNSFSASASEILAAAMQDYKRAIIIGTNTTFGKGTVQTFDNIDNYLTKEYKELFPLGHIKLTIQKFYRINGGSTQLKGVVPDVILPDMYQNIPIGEKELDYPMPWNKIDAEQYAKWSKSVDSKKIIQKSIARTKKDSAFIQITESAQWLANKTNASNISLSYTDFRSRYTQDSLLSEKYKNAGKKTTALQVIPFSKEVASADMVADSIAKKKTDTWHKELREDVELFESYRIILDMIEMQK